MKDGMHIVVSHHCQGEQIDFIQEITMEQLKQIEEIVGIDDMSDDLTIDHAIEIRLQTPADHRESMIAGTAFGEGCSREQATRIVDGKELLTDDEEEAEQEREHQEFTKLYANKDGE